MLVSMKREEASNSWATTVRGVRPPTSEGLVQEVVFQSGAALRVEQALIDGGGGEDLLAAQLHQLILSVQAGQADQVAAVEETRADLFHFSPRANLEVIKAR